MQCILLRYKDLFVFPDVYFCGEIHDCAEKFADCRIFLEPFCFETFFPDLTGTEITVFPAYRNNGLFVPRLAGSMALTALACRRLLKRGVEDAAEFRVKSVIYRLNPAPLSVAFPYPRVSLFPATPQNRLTSSTLVATIALPPLA